jgi:hypothetical protein
MLLSADHEKPENTKSQIQNQMVLEKYHFFQGTVRNFFYCISNAAKIPAQCKNLDINNSFSQERAEIKDIKSTFIS